MNESYDPANHLLVIAVIVFYWHLLRIWHQPPPSDRDNKAGEEKKTAAGPDTKLAGVALQRMEAPSANAAPGMDLAPAVQPGDSLAAIRVADDGFDETSFLAGAARAYELIVNAYAKEDRRSWKDCSILKPPAPSLTLSQHAGREGSRQRLRLSASRT